MATEHLIAKKRSSIPNGDFNPVFSTFRKRDLAAHLEWKDIDYQIKNKHIIKSISGEAHAGEVMAIMGPSGGGKTTLLNLLAGRIQPGRNKKLSGTVTMNGEQVKPMQFRKQVAYVTQEDALFATSTVRESLEFSCRLRLPANTSKRDRENTVDDIIGSLGLTKCEHTMVGNELIRGVSGGEKKRVAIGMELVSSPSILFLDEPTSGLDSFSSLNVARILQSIARLCDCCIITSIHQPSAEIVDTFDNLVLLGAGTVIYQGPVVGMEAPFNAMGYQFPARTNVADYVLTLIQTNALEDLPNNSQNLGRKPHRKSTAAGAERQAQVEAVGVGKKPGVGIQTWELLVREFRSMRRDRTGVIFKLAINVFLSVFFAIIFSDAANLEKSNYSLQTHFGALTLIVFSALLGAVQPALMSFPLERLVFTKEKATNTYGTLPYLVSKMLIELPLSYIINLICLPITYWAIGLHGDFFLFTLVLWGMSLAATSTGMIIGAIVSTPKAALEFAPLVLVPQFLFLGLFVRIDQMPTWLSWVQYLCCAKYALNLGMLLEYDPKYADTLERKQEWIEFMDDNTVYYSETWLYIVLLIVTFVGFRLIALMMLDYKAKNLG